MRFRIVHLLFVTALIAVAALVYSRAGTEHLEFKLLEAVDDGYEISLMWYYRNCPVAEDANNFSTFETMRVGSGERKIDVRAKPGDVVKIYFRRSPVWLNTAEQPWQAVLRRLGLEQQPIHSHNGIVFSEGYLTSN